jgi:hypothetical protein
VVVVARPKLAKDHPEFVIPAKAGIHLDLALLSDHSKIKSRMDPSFRWDDVRVWEGYGEIKCHKQQTRLAAGLSESWIPAFAGMT